jgi:sugar-phosphatase
MRVVGVGARAGFHRPDVVVRDLTQVRVEVVGGGAIRLHVG